MNVLFDLLDAEQETFAEVVLSDKKRASTNLGFGWILFSYDNGFDVYRNRLMLKMVVR